MSLYPFRLPDRVAGTYERMLYLLSDGDAIYKATGSIANFHKSVCQNDLFRKE